MYAGSLVTYSLCLCGLLSFTLKWKIALHLVCANLRASAEVVICVKSVDDTGEVTEYCGEPVEMALLWLHWAVYGTHLMGSLC